ncbi:hypothetical protein BGX27_011408 [Mortierella sp. AM989]|nr:hypothetical protein BGX27_011408 [Mortierella sp. AM989]
MAPDSSILSTHSGHHRIFIGPVVQKNHSHLHIHLHSQSNSADPSAPPPKRSFTFHQNSSASQTPRPWWDQQHHMRSHVSLHGTHHHTSTLTQKPHTNETHITNAIDTKITANSIQQSSIPTHSYTFTDDSECNDTEDERLASQHSDADDLDDYNEGLDMTDDEDDDIDIVAYSHRNSTSTTCSSEPNSAQVGQSPTYHQNDQQPTALTVPVISVANAETKEKGKDKGKDKATDEEDSRVSPIIRWKSKERKRTKTTRDEGEPGGLKRLFSSRKGKAQAKGTIYDDPDLAWEGNRNGVSRQQTSGALAVSHHQDIQLHNTVLVGSPLSSEVDLPSTHPHGGPVFVSSPASSLLDVSIKDEGKDQQERPSPTPLQNMSPKSDEDVSKSDHLVPGKWRPSSTHSGTSSLSPRSNKPQRGSTWMTARESASNAGPGSLQGLLLREEDGIEEENEGNDGEDENEHYTLARVISQDSVANGAGVGSASVAQDQRGATTSASASTSESASTSKASNQASSGKAVKDLAVLEKKQSSSKDSKDSKDSKESSLSRSITKASTRFGRALLNRAPTTLKRQNDFKAEIEHPPASTICSIDKDCQKSLNSDTKKSDKKKHVRFLTKVQYQIAASRQSTVVATSPVVKQDRMLVRKEVTERPGPHQFNAETARKMDRQSLGWKEWWCVLKGVPVGQSPVTKITKKSVDYIHKEKGRLELYYNHKKINTSIILTSRTSISVYSSLDYSIAVTQNYRDAVGLTIYILRPRTISLACAWYMDIYTLLHGRAPIPSFIELGVPDFDVKVRVPIPEDDSDWDDDDEDKDSDEDKDKDEEREGTALSSTLPLRGPGNVEHTSTDREDETPIQSFKTAMSRLPNRMASKSFYLNTDDAKLTLVTPDEVTPNMLRSHALTLLKQVPDWTEVVSLWQDPRQHGDVALCWKRYDRIEWIYWDSPIFAETSNVHLRKDHIGFADGSDWTGGMDETVVGPQVLDKTHRLELRPITHYPTKVLVAEPDEKIKTLYEPDPIEGYMVRVSTFSGNPLRRFRRLYLTSHDNLLMYTVPSHSHSPSMQHVGTIDPEALVFCITPHRSADPDHKDMSQSRSVRRLKAQVRAAQGFIDLTKVGSVRVLKIKEWNAARHLTFKKNKERQNHEAASRREKLGKSVKRMEEDVNEAMSRQRPDESGETQPPQQHDAPHIVIREPDSYFFPTQTTDPKEEEENQGTSTKHSQGLRKQPQHDEEEPPVDHQLELQPTEPLSNTLSGSATTENIGHGRHRSDSKGNTSKHSLHNTATFVADLLHHGKHDPCEDSSVIEIEMQDGKSCVRFRAFNAEAARLWCEQLERLAEYWRHRKHQDVRDHMAIAKVNSQQLSAADDDEHHVTIGDVGITIHDWDNDRAVVSPEIWNWCVVNGCRGVTKAGFVYYKPNILKTFRKMFLVLTEGFLMMFHPYCRSKPTGKVIPTTASRLYGIYSLKDIYIYSGHFSDEDTAHGTNDETERLPRFFPDGLIADDPDEDCTFSIWRGKRKKRFSRRGTALMSMSARPVKGSSKLFGKNGLLSSMVKDGIVYGSPPHQCSVIRARSRQDLEEWVYSINTEIERIVRAERRRIYFTGRV